MADRAIYTVEIGDEEIQFEGPSGLSDEAIEQLADKHLKTARPGQKFPHATFVGEETPAAPVAESESSAGGAFLRNLPHDAFFNVDDEIASFVNAGVPGLAELDNWSGAAGGEQRGPLDGGDFWERVRNNMGDSRVQREADALEHPVASGAGRITGVLSSLPRAASAVAARLPAAATAWAASHPVITAALLSTAGGAASGAGAGEEGTRAQSAALGAGTGLVLGTGLAAGMGFAPAVANYGRIFLNKMPEVEAIRQMVKSLARDGFDVISPSGIQKLRTALQEFTGKPVSLADIGGATRSRTGVGLRSPSAAQQPAIDVIRSRQAGQGTRLAGDVRATVAPRTDVHALDEALVEQRAQEAKRLRDAALFEDVELPTPTPRAQVVPTGAVEAEQPNAGLLRQMGIETPDNPTFTREMVPAEAGPPTAEAGRTSRMVHDPQLNWLARLPLAQKALGKAMELANAERDRLAIMGQPIDHLPDLTRGGTLDARSFDTLKRYMDQEISRAFRGQSDTFTVAQASELKALRDNIRERMREVIPGYGDYLDTYKGSSEMIDSLKAGRTFDDLDPEVIAREQGERSTAGQELYRVGTARNLLDRLKATGDNANPASRIMRSDEEREQLLATGVDPAAAARLNRSIGQERIFNRLPEELAGAQTAQRAMAQADANAGADMAVPFNPGSPLGWMGMMGRSILNRTSVARNAAVNEHFLPMALEQNPQAIEVIINNLEQQGNVAAARLMRRQVAQRRTGLTSGAIIGGPVALGDE